MTLQQDGDARGTTYFKLASGSFEKPIGAMIETTHPTILISELYFRLANGLHRTIRLEGIPNTGRAGTP